MWSLNRLSSVRPSLLMGGLPNFLAVVPMQATRLQQRPKRGTPCNAMHCMRDGDLNYLVDRDGRQGRYGKERSDREITRFHGRQEGKRQNEVEHLRSEQHQYRGVNEINRIREVAGEIQPAHSLGCLEKAGQCCSEKENGSPKPHAVVAGVRAAEE